MKRIFAALIFFAMSTTVFAAEPVAATTGSGLLQVFIGLLVVLGLMFGAAWLLKRFGAPKMASGTNIKIVGGLAVGNRERVIVIEVADQWIVIGVAPGQVNTLSTMPKQEMPLEPESKAAGSRPFAAFLQNVMDKRNGKK